VALLLFSKVTLQFIGAW